MNVPTDSCVRDFGATLLLLRSDLVFTPQRAGGSPYYLVEDPINSRYFRLGLAEYTLVSLMDGQTSIRDALSQLSSAMPNHRLSEQDAATICRWLVEMDLAHTFETGQAAQLAGAASAAEYRQAVGRWNPVTFRLPLGHPDPVFAALARWFGWLFTPWCFFVWAIVVSVGLFSVVSDGARFANSSHGIFAVGNWLWLAACWLVLKLTHETAHGVACRRCGGPVREAGLLFILFAPLAYVDVTSSWRFRSRWERIQVAAAGMLVEMLIASVAGIVWSMTSDGWWNHLCFNIVIMASLTTLLFNANPLMKFDGYYIFSDLLGLPNLYVNGGMYLRYAVRKWFLGVTGALPRWTRRQAFVIRLYGIASFLWRLTVCASLTIAAAALFHGAGIVLACFAVLAWWGGPAVALLRYLIWGSPGEQPRRLRFALTAGTSLSLTAALLLFTPWPGATSAPAVVEYAPFTVVRAGSAGFVKRVHVRAGQFVEAGTLLAELENHELVNELTNLELAIQQSEIRSRQLELQNELAACQAEMEDYAALVKQLREKKQQVERLQVCAPTAGKIIQRQRANLTGTYLKMGDEVVAMGDEASKELRMSISQDQIDVFVDRVGQTLNVDLPGRSQYRAALDRIIPRASLQPPHEALSAANGGPLPVRSVSAEREDASEGEYELFAPRFTGIASLASADSPPLPAGLQCTVSCRPWDRSIGAHFYHVVRGWVRDRFEKHAKG